MPLSIQDLEKLRMGIQNRCNPVVRGVTFTFRPLTISETTDVTSRAMQIFNGLKPHEKHTINESRIISILTLIQASCLDAARAVPGVTEDTLNMLTADELGYLFREYQQMTAACNPEIEQLPVAELQQLVEDLKKNPQRLTELSSLQLLNLVRYLLTKSDLPQDK